MEDYERRLAQRNLTGFIKFMPEGSGQQRFDLCELTNCRGASGHCNTPGCYIPSRKLLYNDDQEAENGRD